MQFITKIKPVIKIPTIHSVNNSTHSALKPKFSRLQGKTRESTKKP